jgi:hypothetical protein
MTTSEYIDQLLYPALQEYCRQFIIEQYGDRIPHVAVKDVIDDFWKEHMHERSNEPVQYDSMTRFKDVLAYLIGTSRFYWKGEWTAAGEYKVNDCVYYQGSSYCCVKDVSGTPPQYPVDTEFWGRCALGLSGGQLQLATDVVAACNQAMIDAINAVNNANLAVTTANQAGAAAQTAITNCNTATYNAAAAASSANSAATSANNAAADAIAAAANANAVATQNIVLPAPVNDPSAPASDQMPMLTLLRTIWNKLFHLYGQDTALQANIDAEAQLRIGGDAAEAQLRIGGDAAERAYADAADSTIMQGLAQEAADRQAAINQEIVDRTLADTAMQQNIVNIANDTQNLINTANSNLMAYIDNADSVIQQSIISEGLDRATADTALQANIDAEAQTRAAADNDLQTSIGSEASARIDADAVLQTAIDGKAAAVHTHVKADVTDFAHTHVKNDITDFPALAAVATSGSYTDLSNKPTIPAAQVNADWNASSGIAQILNKPSIPQYGTESITFYSAEPSSGMKTGDILYTP